MGFWWYTMVHPAFQASSKKSQQGVPAPIASIAVAAPPVAWNLGLLQPRGEGNLVDVPLTLDTPQKPWF